MDRQDVLNAVEQYYNEHMKGSSRDSVPVSGKVYDAEELKYGVEAVLDGWWTDGRFSEQLERDLADFVGVRYGALTNSGSSANLIAFATLTSHELGKRQVKPGDEVITVAAGFPATVTPIIQYGCVPVFVDVDPTTHNIDVSQLEEARSDKTRAIMIAHTLGNPFDLGAVREFCDKYNLWLVEDNCDALGAEYNGQRTGSFGDISTVSFYPAHHMTTGEGGIVLTNKKRLDKIIRSFRDWGRDCWCKTGQDNTCKKRFEWQLGRLPAGYDHKYIYSHIGYNLKLTDLQAAIGVAQFKKLPSFIEARVHNHDALRTALGEFSNYFDFCEPTPNSKPSWFGFLMTIKKDAPFERRALMEFLNERKIGTRLLFAGNLTRQPLFQDNDIQYRVVGDLKHTDNTMDNTFWIGCYPGITADDITTIHKAFADFLVDHQQ